MKTIKNYFFRDIGVMLGRSMLHIFRNMNAISTVVIMPIVFMLLLLYIIGGMILMLEELFFPSS